MGLGLALFMLILLSVSLIASQETRLWSENIYDIRNFVNEKASLLGYTQVPVSFNGQGFVSNDAVTADKVCDLAGYKTVESRGCVNEDGKCIFTTPYNNVVGVWDVSENDFEMVSAVGKTWLASLTCSDPFECFDDIECDDSDSYTNDICENPGYFIHSGVRRIWRYLCSFAFYWCHARLFFWFICSPIFPDYHGHAWGICFGCHGWFGRRYNPRTHYSNHHCF